MSHLPEGKTYYIESYGCQMNLYDADLMAGILEDAGYSPAEGIDKADVILVNTCSVREHAEQRAIGRIRELGGLKKQRPQARLVVCGCMAQRLGEEMLRLVSGVDLVVGTDGYRNLPKLINRSESVRIAELSVCPQERYSQVNPRHRGQVSAFVAVMRGCDNRCSYCIVPMLRGPARSRSLDEILGEAATLADRGCREIIFLGQNVNVYRDGRYGFADLLRKTNQISRLGRIRFLTSHPRDMSEEMLMAMTQTDKVCEHLHLPLQSGSDKILRAMRRGYSAKQYRSLVRRARELMPNLSVTTDLIAGFPGETEQDFQETIRLMEDLQFDDAFTFLYSPRPGTEAAKLSGQVPSEVRHHRLERIIALQREITHRANQGLVGSTVEVLVERRSKRKAQELLGRTRTYKSVVFPGDETLVGRLVQIRVKKARGGTAWGEKVPELEKERGRGPRLQGSVFSPSS
jgi:tRNA-2-methylthio-N6-dimethylallyladenosine synthase